ncbi:DeoR/GlpR family DNA-binding transcription regulator [Pararhizobium sp.]|uniref:DeoR/GlpR family DNA-binding transcription regulator n=1 Tax=Pararhizobium sp. TaxID=1977563 RepID=UPI00271AED0D|nr:DeoR/GlpR family DNA-binding transcription regulator [Pararhizobium sp.]MDO9416643.1 DeoR/GlpR family DNA-binding transcription regulator [Pararhizobium sp.]
MQADLLLRERHELICERLRTSGRVLASKLAQELQVSDDTIRRDLRDLAAAGRCQRVYGGALPVASFDTSLAERLVIGTERKAALARATAGFLLPGMTVFLDAGSTNLAIARAIPANSELTVVTNTPVIAAALMETPGLQLVLIGGPIDRHIGAAIGAKAIREIGLLRTDLCVLGVCGVDVEAGLTAVHFDDAEFKRSVAERSRSVLVPATNDKLGVVSTYSIVPLAECQTLLLEADADRLSVGAYQAHGVTVVQAQEALP